MYTWKKMCKILLQGGFCLSGKWLVPLSHGIIKHSQHLLAGYKEQKTDTQLQTQLLGSSLQTEESRMAWGGGFFFFSFPSFQDLSVKKDALIQAVGLQLGTCTIPHVRTLLKRHKWLFEVADHLVSRDALQDLGTAACMVSLSRRLLQQVGAPAVAAFSSFTSCCGAVSLLEAV